MCQYCDHINEKYFKEPKHGDLRVWWMPQVGAADACFHYPVKSIAEAKHMLDMLAFYDLFQFEHHIKPDFANCGGLQEYDANMEIQDPENADEERWCDWYNEDGYGIDEVDDEGKTLVE